MGTVANFLLGSFVVVIAQGEVRLEADRPFLKVEQFGQAVLECCYTTGTETVTFSWIRRLQIGKVAQGVTLLENSEHTKIGNKTHNGKFCGTVTLTSLRVNDTGFYWCFLNGTELYTHGTYLLVYKPLEKTIGCSESTKNNILTAEGILLLLFVIVPSAILLSQSKRLYELEKKKVKKEEENIYQGLNLDDCSATYDQIERSQANGPYQDVCNIVEEEEEIQLEKP